MPLRAPQRVYDFTQLSRTRPREQQPGDRLDAQFDEHAQSIRSIIEHLRLEEAPRRPDELAELRRQVDGVLQSVVEIASVARARGEEATARIEASLAQAQEAFRSAQRSADALRLDRDEAREQLVGLQAKIDQLEARIAGLEGEPLLGPNAGGFYSGDVLGATATSADYAQVSIEWAEHMPDTIPGNILAINAITGDHWSARWWANRASNAFGMLQDLYLGVWPTPPATNNTGGPIAVGSIYYDSTTMQPYVWTGTAWESFWTPQKAATATLYYVSGNGQSAFPLTIPDFVGNTGTLVDEGVMVYLNGVRLTPYSDYTVDVPSSTVTLVRAQPAGAMVAIDVLTPADELRPGAVLATMLQDPVVDGVKTQFPLVVLSSGVAADVQSAAHLIVSVDGVIQKPGVQYSVSAPAGVSTITFVGAPGADSAVWMVWLEPGP